MKTAPTFASRRALGSFALVLALAVTATAAAVRGDETLRWKFAKGQKLNYVFSQKTTTKSDVMGQKVDALLTQTMEIRWDVKEVDSNGTATMDQTIERVVFSIKGPQGGEVTVDTSKDEKIEGPFAEAVPLFKALTGSPFIVLKMSARGEISDEQVPKKVLDALSGAGGAARGIEMFSEKGLKDLPSQVAIVFPKEPLAKGVQWSSAKVVNIPFGTMKLDNTYTYEGPSGASEKIDLSFKIDLKPADKIPFEISLTKQDNTGTTLFDNKTGVLRSSELIQKTQMKVKMQNMERVLDIETTMTMEQPKSAAPK